MKKIFTLLTLALMSIGTAWADETIFSYTVSGTDNPSEEGWDSKVASGTIGGNCAFYYKKEKGYFAKYLDTDAYCLNGGAASVKLTLAGSEKFEAGDKVIVTFASNGSSQRSFYVRTAYNDGTTQIESSKHANSFSSETVTLSSDFNLNEIYIERNGGMYISSVRVDRPALDPASPTIDTDLSTTPVDASVGIGVDLSIVASHVTGYQWYRNSSASTTGATLITGATSANYTFIPETADAETTVYLYCVVTNDNATGTKTATSSIAQVNVGAVATLTPVSRNIWNIGDFSDATYSVATIVNNLEICNGTIDNGSKIIDGFTLSKRIKINKDATATNRYIKFKVVGPCVITVYGMSGGSQDRTLGINIGGSEVATLVQDNTEMGKVSYNYTSATEAEVVLFCKEGSGTFNVHGITVSDVNVTVSEYGWSTYVAEENVVVSDIEGLEAYAITGASGTAITKSDALTTIKAGVPVLLKGTASQKFYLPLAGSGAADPSDNLLIAGAGANVNYNDNAGFNYVLGVEGGKAMFLRIVSGTPANVPVGKAYLALTSDPAGARTLDLDGDVTAIKNIKVGTEDNVYYDLQGRRVLYPTKGLYIVNGKKVIIK